MDKGKFRFNVICTILIIGFLGFLGYAEIFVEETNVASKGDSVAISYTYKDAEGEEQEGAKDYLIGSNELTDSFDAALTGAKKGDEMEITASYPEDFDTTVSGAIPGETVVYDVTVNKVLICTGPEDACLDE